MVTLGLIVGNRGFFPNHLCLFGRESMLALLRKQGIDVVTVAPEQTRMGAIESLDEARSCAELFKQHRAQIDGVLVTLPNFGDERAIANTLRWADLNVPVLIHSFRDSSERMTIKDRRDSFCGKMSVCNNLYQYGIQYSLTREHTMNPEEPAFVDDLRWFTTVCTLRKSLCNLRFGQIGARPAAFNTVRYSEKILERHGISVETLDLAELLGWIRRLPDSEPSVQAKLDEMRGYTNVSGIPAESLMKMAKLGSVIDKWMADLGLAASALQCWTALEEFYGVVPCTCMSMMSNNLMASACEADIAGVLSMYVLQQAAARPAALLDWNNNFGADPNKGVVFHCSNLPKDFFISQKMDYQEIIAGTVGKENTYGTIVGRVAAGPFSYCRISTDDNRGTLKAYVGEGRFTEDELDTFGGYGVFEVPRLQALLKYICQNGFEHHVAATRAEVADAVVEALGRYAGWDVYQHES